MRFLVIFCCIFFCSICHSQLQFQEISSSVGLTNTSYGNGTLGGGVSFFDFDNDGWDDLTLSSQEGDPIRFFKNNNGSFIEIFPEGIQNNFETKTVQWVDIDNDGDYDFFATSNISSSKLYENLGNLIFQDITEIAGLELPSEFTIFGSSWGDYNNDGFLDVFLSSRVEGSLDTQSLLFDNNGNNTFSNATSLSGLSPINNTSFCAAFFDYNKDGFQDIYVANDRLPKNQLYLNNGDETFTEVGVDSGTGVVMDAMSTAIDDYNNDGWLDIYVTNTFDGNAFFENNGDGTFNNIASSNGTLMESVGWGAVFLDADNNGDKDLYVSGELTSTSDFLPAAFYYNDGLGNFSIPENIGLEDDARSFANAIGDINNDGFPEIAVLNFEPNNAYLWSNETSNSNNWIKVKLEGTESNRMGIGSWIEISVNGEKQFNYTLCGEGYLGQNSAYEFFGIGQEDTIDYIKVTWLSGEIDLIEENIPINEAVTIIEGTNTLDINDTTLMSFSLYPNPSHNYIQLQGLSKRGGVIRIYDVTGKLIRSQEVRGSTIQLSVSNFKNGLYLVNYTTDEGQVNRKLLIN